MRGNDLHQTEMFSYISAKRLGPEDHPIRPIRKMVDGILVDLPAACGAERPRETVCDR